MSVQEIAEAAFEAVQTKYRTNSAKSSNKSYSDEAMAELEGEPDLKRGRKQRFAARDATHEARAPQNRELNAGFGDDTSGRSLDVVYGDLLFKMASPVLNCEELARMACYVVSQRTNEFCMVNLTPADHSFCVVGRTAGFIDKNISKWTLTELKDHPWPDAYVVDVWMNICCPLHEYGEKASERLQLWAGKGKRIAWTAPGEDEDSWADPGGDYATAFLASSIVP